MHHDFKFFFDDPPFEVNISQGYLNNLFINSNLVFEQIFRKTQKSIY